MLGKLWTKIKSGLAKTRSLFSGVAELFRLKGRVDQQFLRELEKRLYLADVGTVATTEIVADVRQAFQDKEITGDVESFVMNKVTALVSVAAEGSRRRGCEIINNAQGSDPASVAHDACEKATARTFDVLIVDTAGRLHTQV